MAGFSISDLIMDQMKQSGKDKVTTQKTEVPQEPIDFGQLGMMLALLLSGGLKNKETMMGTNPGNDRTLPALDQLPPSYWSNSGNEWSGAMSLPSLDPGLGRGQNLSADIAKVFSGLKLPNLSPNLGRTAPGISGMDPMAIFRSLLGME